MKEKKYNYVYCITYIDNMQYIGVRSCNCKIQDDTYMGSAFHIPDNINITGKKEILSIHKSRDKAVLEEIRLHKLYNVKDNPAYYNQCNSNSVNFHCSVEGQRRSAETRRGRTKSSHIYIKNQIKSREQYNKYKQWTTKQLEGHTKQGITKKQNILDGNDATGFTGKNRTKAQLAGSIIQSNKIRGIKNPLKGHPGTSSTSFTPWYYISPDGIRTEVFNQTKKEYAETSEFTLRQITHRFNHKNEHKPAKTLPMKGWIFGNTQEPVQTTAKRKHLNTGID